MPRVRIARHDVTLSTWPDDPEASYTYMLTLTPVRTGDGADIERIDIWHIPGTGVQPGTAGGMTPDVVVWFFADVVQFEPHRHLLAHAANVVVAWDVPQADGSIPGGFQMYSTP